uniref:PX domain-containing protein n=1 Tax=Sinocyclocheilus anshuiensis TaxID=1608454 RepID=A0A671M9Y7_9TELE
DTIFAEAELSVSVSSIRITDVTQDGDVLTFLNSSAGVCVFRTYEDFDWLQQSLFSQENLPGLHGIIFPPLPSKALPSQPNTQTKALKQLGFLALGQAWKSYCKALEFYLQQVAAHPTLCKCKALDSFFINSESPGRQRGRKGIFNRLSQVVEEMRKESHKVCVSVDCFESNCPFLLVLLKEMLFRRTCKLIELETVKKSTEKAKANKREVVCIHLVIYHSLWLHIERFHSSRVNVLKNCLIGWCEQQLNTAKEFAELYSQHLEACRNMYTE